MVTGAIWVTSRSGMELWGKQGGSGDGHKKILELSIEGEWLFPRRTRLGSGVIPEKTNRKKVQRCETAWLPE